MKVAPDGGVYVVMPSAWTGAQCAACKGGVGAGELLLGTRQAQGAVFEWQHFACAGDEQLLRIRHCRHLNGIEALGEEDQDTVIAAFEAVEPPAPPARRKPARGAAAPRRGPRRRKQPQQAESSSEEDEAGEEEEAWEDEWDEEYAPRARPQQRQQPTAAAPAPVPAAPAAESSVQQLAAAEQAAAAAGAGGEEHVPALHPALHSVLPPAELLQALQLEPQPEPSLSPPQQPEWPYSPLQQMLYVALLEQSPEGLPEQLAPYFAASTGPLDDATLLKLVLGLCGMGVLPPGWPEGTPLLRQVQAMPAVAAVAAAAAEAPTAAAPAAAAAMPAAAAAVAEVQGSRAMAPAQAALNWEGELCEELAAGGEDWEREAGGSDPAEAATQGLPLLQAGADEEGQREPPPSPPAPGTAGKAKATAARRKSRRVAARRRQRAQAYASDDEWMP